MIKVTRTSPFSGQTNTMSFDMTDDEFTARVARYQDGALIQDAFDNLNADEREFLMTGITPAEWDAAFGE
jgi:hypothetical protein